MMRAHGNSLAMSACVGWRLQQLDNLVSGCTGHVRRVLGSAWELGTQHGTTQRHPMKHDGAARRNTMRLFFFGNLTAVF
eukprot:1160229-Pelagomonas_calceolata.AAC.4